MTESVFGRDGDAEDAVSSHDADVDAGFDDDSPATDLADGSDLAGAGTSGESHQADVDAGFDDGDSDTV